VPLLVGVIAAVSRREHGGLGWNRWGLALSSVYLAWSVLAQWHVRGVVEDALAAQGRPADRLLVTPTPFNTVLWRVVAMRGDGYEEAFYSLLDGSRQPRWERFASDRPLEQTLQAIWAVQRMAWFSHGFYRIHQQGGYAFVTDLRMGQEPHYTFSFRVARRQGRDWVPVLAQNHGRRPPDPGAALRWIGRRMLGAEEPPPR
jgi:inner membrane protein